MIAMFEREVYMPFQLCDAAGIVFFGHVFSIAHEVYELFVQEKLNVAWDEWFNNPEWIIPIKESKAQYFAPLSAGQKYTISLNILGLSTSSVSFSFLFKKDLKQHCLVETVHVFCNRQKKVKQPIPWIINQKLQDLLLS